MKVHILQHSLGTPPGSLLDWTRERGHEAIVHRLDQGPQLPTLSEIDLLVILGGPMSVDQITLHPWLVSEKDFLKQAIRFGTTCLGLCLGGQLLAESLGAKVQNSGSWEIGWHPISFANSESLVVFQWHQDCFSLPNGAERIAGNSFSENQAFSYGKNIIGTQFHPEATIDFVRECAEDSDYPSGSHVQDRESLLRGTGHLAAMRSWFFSLLDDLSVTRKI